MKAKKYIELINESKDFDDIFYRLSDAIDSMSDQERKELRYQLESMGEKRILRNLTYNYETQKWIE